MDLDKSLKLGANNNTCAVCERSDNLQRCGRCRLILYCSKEHQRQHWKRHKHDCKPSEEPPKSEVKCDRKSYINIVTSQNVGHRIPKVGSSEREILSARMECLSPNHTLNTQSTTATMPNNNHKPHEFPGVCLREDTPPSGFVHFNSNSITDEICRTVIKDMETFGLCVLDNFLGEEQGRAVLDEVLDMYTKGIFKDGQLVSTGRLDSKIIRGDQVTWIDGREKYCRNIGYLISRVDTIVMKANRMLNNGMMGMYNITGRTKAMVACYPGSGSRYVAHVDNPNRDGRCITAIYYLNLNWDVKKSGGLLRIFPGGWSGDKVADIEPVFDRLLFFWSDRRNPHEVQPAFHTRYAITLWYFDANEREEALRRYQLERAGKPVQGAASVT